LAIALPDPTQVRDLLRDFPWPESFLIGTATAGYQCEGGYNVGDGPRNNWAEWESRPGNERTGAGARFWDFPDRDLELARGLGLNAHRLSIEWARLQPIAVRRVPHTPPPWDFQALDRYVEILVKSRQLGMEPIVTLHHFTHPYWVGHDLWLDDAGVDRFVKYVDELLPALTERLLARGQKPIRYWLTVNEPNTIAPGSYLGRLFPSDHELDLGSPARMVRALDGIYAGHVRAYNSVHRYYSQQKLDPPLVSVNNFALDFYEADRFFIDFMLAKSRGIPFGPALQRDVQQRAAAWSEMLKFLIGHSRRTSPERWLAAHGFRLLGPRLFTPDRLPRTRAAIEASDWARPLDYLCFDYYDATLANQLQLTTGAYEPWQWEAIPEGLYEVLRAYATDGLPVLIGENGLCVRRPIGDKPEPRPDGGNRADFIRAHLFHTLRALKDGVPVMGYLHWSLTDNYEWGRFSPRFGLFGVDYSSEERPRIPTDAAGVDAASVYQAIAQALLNRDGPALELALTSTG
jgi:beta-glucosidase/6-phospho-beta-glucosidase/beta-galactosidase